MSRSCQSATFSNPTSACPRTTRARPQMRSDTIGLRLCGMADEPFCPAAERLFDLTHLRAREMADLEREPVERRRHDRQRSEELCMPVALEDLRRGRRRIEPERLACEALHLWRRGRVRPDRARELSDSQPFERVLESDSIALELEHPAEELETERGGLRVHSVRTPDRDRVAVLLRTGEHSGRSLRRYRRE